MNKSKESKHWESLYYKENALVGLLKSKVKSLEAKIDYLQGKIFYIEKYEVNHD